MSAPSRLLLSCVRKCQARQVGVLNLCRYAHRTPRKYAEQQETKAKDTVPVVEDVDIGSGDFDFDLEEDLIYKEELSEKLRRLQDCSGLNDFEKARLNNQKPDFSLSKNKNVKKRFFQRRLYGIYGMESEVKPGILWPSKAELADLKEIDRDWTPSFHELVQKVQDRKQAAAEVQRLREEKVNKNLSKMDTMIAQYEKRNEKVTLKAKDDGYNLRTEELLNEFRELYGFSVKPTSSKFTAFRAKRTMETKETRKKADRMSKKEKNAKAIAELLQHGSGSKH